MEIKILPDASATSPREWENGSLFFGWHKRKNIGDDKPHAFRDSQAFDGWDDVERAIREEYDPIALFPVYMLDHSGVAFSIDGFSCPWDSGQVGFIFVPRSMADHWSADVAVIEKGLRAELDAYQTWANGWCVGYVVEEDGEELDSCWGFYSEEDARTQAEASVRFITTQREKRETEVEALVRTGFAL